jgi:hypothetical protein
MGPSMSVYNPHDPESMMEHILATMGTEAIVLTVSKQGVLGHC